MARIKIDMPEKYVFSTELSVRASDVNYGGHLGNDSMLSLLNEARIRFLKSNGFTELDTDGAGIIMSDAAINYKAEAFHGDSLIIEIAVADFGRGGCDLLYRVTDKKTGREVARAKTGIAFFDYTARKLVRVPERFLKLFGPSSA